MLFWSSQCHIFFSYWTTRHKGVPLAACIPNCTQLKINTFSGTLAGEAGVHNDNEKEKGRGRSTNHPRERLKFQKFSHSSHVTLEHWHNAHGANRPQARQVSKFYIGQ